jgi:hypothetical protein
MRTLFKYIKPAYEDSLQLCSCCYRSSACKFTKHLLILVSLELMSSRPRMEDRTETLSIREHMFRDADDSVLSIIPSRQSSRVSLHTLIKDGDEASIRSSASSKFRYSRLSFENQLFTSKTNCLLLLSTNAITSSHTEIHVLDHQTPYRNQHSQLLNFTRILTRRNGVLQNSQPWKRLNQSTQCCSHLFTHCIVTLISLRTT